ncbi:MAG: HpcH/HpaI aldolase family protein [Solirubrobacteraceae bacterium]
MRRLIEERIVACGGWCMVPSAFATEVVSASGCDWLCIDTQHGLIDDALMRLMVQAAAIRGTPVLVRVAWNEPAAIMRALDAGADGVIVPMVNTADEARAAVTAGRYPPLGYRSWGPLRSGMAQAGFNAALGNEQTVVLVMIETEQAVSNLDAILDVPGVDGVMVGPNDLALSHAGTNDGAGTSPYDVEMIERVADGCRQRGLAAGISSGTVADARRWIESGYTLVGLASDAALIGECLTRMLAGVREAGN